MWKIRISLAAYVLATAAIVYPGEYPKLLRKSLSPLGSIELVYYRTGKESNQIWLVPKNNSTSKSLLYQYSRDADVLFAPNESWLAINDHVASNVTEVHLFKRGKGISYEEVNKPSLHDEVWNLFERSQGLRIDFAHAYTTVVRWAANSRALLVDLSGDGERTSQDRNFVMLKPWLCVFDIEKGQASFDLRLMNQDTVHTVREED